MLKKSLYPPALRIAVACLGQVNPALEFLPCWHV